MIAGIYIIYTYPRKNAFLNLNIPKPANNIKF